MDVALSGTALLMGLAGTPHCLAMCGPACAGIQSQGRMALVSFHLSRLLSYATGGAIAAASVGFLAQWGQSSAMLRPFWILLHLAALALGLWLAWRGEQPAWMQGASQAAARQWGVPATALQSGRTAVARPLKVGIIGLAWAALPCGLLQSALVLSALASGPWQGAGVMATFALGSGLGLLLGPLLLWRLLRWARLDEARGMRWATRLAGASLVGSALFALGHGVWAPLVAFCT